MQCLPGLPCQRLTGNTQYLGMWLKTQPALKLTEKTGIRAFLATPGQALSGLWYHGWALAYDCVLYPLSQ